MSEEPKLMQFYYKKSRIQQLKGFCYTYQEQSVTKAAERMNLGVSTVTMQIKSLEDDLNTKLFKRIKNKLIPTEKGELLYEMALPIIQSADGLFEKFLNESSEVENNKIRIGAYHVVFSHILPRKIKELLLNFPETKFTLKNIPRSQAYKELLDDNLDMVIYPIEENEQIPIELESIANFNYDLVLIVNKDNPLAKKQDTEITKKDIANNNFIYHLNKNMMTAGTWLEFVSKYHPKTNIEMDGGTWEMVKEMVRENIGIGVMSKTYINNKDKDLVLKSIGHLFPDFKFQVIVKKNGYITKASEELIKLIKSDN